MPRKKKRSREGRPKRVICGSCGNMFYTVIPDISEEPKRFLGVFYLPGMRKAISCPYCKVVYFHELERWIAQVPVELEVSK